MPVLRPSSSVLKPGVRERQRELETVITKYELLLAIGKTKNPDFASLDLPQLIFRLAVRLQRAAWQIDRHGQEPALPDHDEEEESSIAKSAETMQTTLEDMLEKTRRLYQLPDIATSKLAVQGEIQVLLETGDLLSFYGNQANAMISYAEAIRLCYNVEDETTEAILTSKLRKLQRHADAMERVESLVNESTSDGDNDAESERNRLKTAFAKLADTNGLVTKDQLQEFAQELGMHDDALSTCEVDEIWRQIQRSGKSASISFETLWTWWMSDTVHEYMKNNVLL